MRFPIPLGGCQFAIHRVIMAIRYLVLNDPDG